MAETLDDETEKHCAFCLQLIPQSQTPTDEALAYLQDFCGLECYERWKKTQETGGPPDKKA